MSPRRRPRSLVSPPATSGGSAAEMWLAITMSGPSWGSGPSISIVTLAPRRSTVRASAAANLVDSGAGRRARSVIDRRRTLCAADDGDDLGNGLLERVARGVDHLRAL